MEDDLNFLTIEDNLIFFGKPKTTLIFLKMKDDLNFLEMEDNLNFFKMRDNLNFINRRRPHCFFKRKNTSIYLSMEDNHKKNKKCNLKPKIKDDFHAILTNSTAQFFPGNLTNTTTKNILAQLKKNQP